MGRPFLIYGPSQLGLILILMSQSLGGACRSRGAPARRLFSCTPLSFKGCGGTTVPLGDLY